MNRPRWQKVLSDIWKNKSRSLLVIASIAVGLFAIGIISKTYIAISRDMRLGYEAINPANIQVQTGLINEEVVNGIEHIDGINQVEVARHSSMQVQGRDGNWESIYIITRDFSETVINQVEVLSGSWPPNDQQVVLADHKLSNIDADVGDWISFRNSKGDVYSLQIIGIVKDQTIGSISGNGGYFNAPVRAFITEKTLEKMNIPSPDLYNELVITISGDSTVEENLTSEAELVRKHLEDSQISVENISIRSSYHHANKELVDAIIGILIFLGFLVVFLSAFLITNTLQSLLNQQIIQIGIMKTVGAKRSQISMVYMTLIGVFGLLAFVIAYPTANLAATQIVKFLARQINFQYSGEHFEPVVLFIELILALVVPGIAAFFPIQNGVKISVNEALSGIRDVEQSGSNWIDQVLSRLRKISRPFSIALRNIFRRKGRLILTLITLTLGGAVFISVFNVRISLSNYINQLSHYFLADLNLSLARTYPVDEISSMLLSDPEISRVEAWDQLQSSVILPDQSIGDNVNLVAVPNQSQLIDPILINGRWLLPEDANAIVLNDQFLNQYPWISIGDTLQLQIDDNDTDWVVVGFFQLAGKIGGLAAYINQDYFTTLPGHQQSKASIYRIVSSRTLDSTEQKNLAAKVQNQLDAHAIQVRDLTTGSRINDSSAEGFSVLTTFLLVMAILIALVGCIGLAGTMSMNVMDRTREIGVMRSIGASDTILMKMVLVEGVGIGWISWLLGAIFSFPISSLLSDLVTRALFGGPAGYGFTVNGFLIWFVIVTVLAVLASYMPARSATNITIREVLAYE